MRAPSFLGKGDAGSTVNLPKLPALTPDLADAAVVGIADIEVAVTVDRDISGAVELGAGGRSVVAGESAEARAVTGAVA